MASLRSEENVLIIRQTPVLSILITYQRGSVVSALDAGSGGRGFDSQPSHVVIALGKQFTLTFPRPPTCKMGTQL